MQTPAGATVPKNIDVQVCVDVTDVSGVAAVMLQSSLDGFIGMVNTGGNTYCGTIPKHNNQTVAYLITAFDSLSNTSNTFGSYAQTD